MVERGQFRGGEVAQRRGVRSQRGDDEGLGQPVVAGERGVTVESFGFGFGEPVATQQCRAQFLPIQGAGDVEAAAHVFGERGVPAFHEDVVEVPCGNDVGDEQRVFARHHQLRHQFQRRALTLQHARQRHERFHQGWGERVHSREVLLAAAILRSEQHVPGFGGLHLGQGRTDLRCCRLIARREQALVGDLGKVGCCQIDAVEASLPPAEGITDGHALSPRHVDYAIAEKVLQFTLAGHQRQDRQVSNGSASFHEVGHFAAFCGHEILIGQAAGQPKDEFVEEQHHCVVAEGLGVRGHTLQTRSHIHPLAHLSIGREDGVDEIHHEPLTVEVASGRVHSGQQGGLVPVACLRPPRAGRTGVQLGQESLGAYLRHVAACVVNHGVALVQLRERCARVFAGDRGQVAAEQGVFERRHAVEVVLHGEVLLAQYVLVLADHLLQPGQRPGLRRAAQDEVEHGHEVALTRTERAVDERALGTLLLQRDAE